MFFSEHGEEIGNSGIAASLREQRRDLPSMMGLVVEQMQNGAPKRKLRAPGPHARVHERFGEPFRGEPGDP
jgi:hypothetical protein